MVPVRSVCVLTEGLVLTEVIRSRAGAWVGMVEWGGECMMGRWADRGGGGRGGGRKGGGSMVASVWMEQSLVPQRASGEKVVLASWSVNRSIGRWAIGGRKAESGNFCYCCFQLLFTETEMWLGHGAASPEKGEPSSWTGGGGLVKCGTGHEWRRQFVVWHSLQCSGRGSRQKFSKFTAKTINVGSSTLKRMGDCGCARVKAAYMRSC